MIPEYKNIRLGSGTVVHLGVRYGGYGMFFSACGAGECSTGRRKRSSYSFTEHAVTCERCLKSARHAPEQPAAVTLEWRDFIDALVMHVSKMIETANRTNRFTADICDYRAAWWLDYAERMTADPNHNTARYRTALRRSQYYQRGAALARESGRKVMQVNAGREYNEDWRATEPTPGELLKGSGIHPDDYQYEMDHEQELFDGNLRI